jgi:hypothetical protein
MSFGIKWKWPPQLTIAYDQISESRKHISCHACIWPIIHYLQKKITIHNTNPCELNHYLCCPILHINLHLKRTWSNKIIYVIFKFLFYFLILMFFFTTLKAKQGPPWKWWDDISHYQNNTCAHCLITQNAHHTTRHQWKMISFQTCLS